jgi:hypothetical protein
MLVRAAVCPHPPALVPAVSQGSAGRLADLRDACSSAAGDLAEADLDVLVCVGAGHQTRRWGPDGGGSLRPFGVNVSLGGAESGLPLSLTLANYLLASASVTADGYQAIAADATSDECRSIGAGLAGLAARVGLLVMADGSARRTRHSPGPFDVRAESYDESVLSALTAPDPEALLALDPGLADELWVAGRPGWQALAGAVLASPGRWTGVTRYAEAPLGVGYVVVQLDRE